MKSEKLTTYHKLKLIVICHPREIQPYGDRQLHFLELTYLFIEKL